MVSLVSFVSMTPNVMIPPPERIRLNNTLTTAAPPGPLDHVRGELSEVLQDFIKFVIRNRVSTYKLFET